MQNKIKEILKKSTETLERVKEELAKNFEGFGAAIGGGTTESPTIKPSSATSHAGGSWFGQSEKSNEKVDYFDNGQWNISEEIKDDGKSKS